MDLDKTAEPMNMHDQCYPEKARVYHLFELFRSFLFILFVSLFDFRRKGSNKLEILKLFLGSDI